MRVVTVARKPCEGGVTDNVVHHQAGALNIEDSRVGSRWPANMLVLHRPACRVKELLQVKGYVINRWKDGAKPFGGGAGHAFESQATPDEEIKVWECEEGCAGQAFDPHSLHCFKQFQPEDTENLFPVLGDYLRVLIAPPEETAPLLLLGATSKDELFKLEGSSVHGAVLEQDLKPFIEELQRVLRPGAHLLVISMAKSPSGWETACALEDAGFEIRDAISVVEHKDEVHLFSKPSGKEKNAGVLPKKDPLKNRMVQNHHSTVKPLALMRSLLEGVPCDPSPVLDPFMGSGTTGAAAAMEGYSFVGIEQDESYLEVADQRVRHWDRSVNAWRAATIISDADPEKTTEEEAPMKLEDLFSL